MKMMPAASSALVTAVSVRDNTWTLPGIPSIRFIVGSENRRRSQGLSVPIEAEPEPLEFVHWSYEHLHILKVLNYTQGIDKRLTSSDT